MTGNQNARRIGGRHEVWPKSGLDNKTLLDPIRERFEKQSPPFIRRFGEQLSEN